jgi:hypothetical protein
MDCTSTLDGDVNALLAKAGEMRRAAGAATMPDYRARMLKAARQLEAKAIDIEMLEACP